jgi:hypothetical protein
MVSHTIAARNSAALAAVMLGFLGVTHAAAEDLSCAVPNQFSHNCAVDVGASPESKNSYGDTNADRRQSYMGLKDRAAAAYVLETGTTTSTATSEYGPIATTSPDSIPLVHMENYSLIEQVRTFNVSRNVTRSQLFWNYKADLARFEMGQDTSNQTTRKWLADWLSANNSITSELIVKLTSILSSYDVTTQTASNGPIFQTPEVRKAKFVSWLGDPDRDPIDHHDSDGKSMSSNESNSENNSSNSSQSAVN